MINVPIAITGEIAKGAKAGIGDFVQHISNGLFPAYAEPDIWINTTLVVMVWGKLHLKMYLIRPLHRSGYFFRRFAN
jgi:hypothetical protein